ncbi:MAG: hypothetical protein V1754_04520 [Pseudomonadota bacterium]
MIRNIFLTLFLGIVIFGGVYSCIRKPKIEYSIDQIAQIDSTTEIMRLTYHEMKPVWDIHENSTYTQEDFATMARAAERVRIAAGVLKDRIAQKYPEKFAEIAARFFEQANKFQVYADGRQAIGAKSAITSMGDLCSTCHKAFR